MNTRVPDISPCSLFGEQVTDGGPHSRPPGTQLSHAGILEMCLAVSLYVTCLSFRSLPHPTKGEHLMGPGRRCFVQEGNRTLALAMSNEAPSSILFLFSPFPYPLRHPNKRQTLARSDSHQTPCSPELRGGTEGWL